MKVPGLFSCQSYSKDIDKQTHSRNWLRCVLFCLKAHNPFLWQHILCLECCLVLCGLREALCDTIYCKQQVKAVDLHRTVIEINLNRIGSIFEQRVSARRVGAGDSEYTYLFISFTFYFSCVRCIATFEPSILHLGLCRTDSKSHYRSFITKVTRRPSIL